MRSSLERRSRRTRSRRDLELSLNNHSSFSRSLSLLLRRSTPSPTSPSRSSSLHRSPRRRGRTLQHSSSSIRSLLSTHLCQPNSTRSDLPPSSRNLRSLQMILCSCCTTSSSHSRRRARPSSLLTVLALGSNLPLRSLDGTSFSEGEVLLVIFVVG